MIGSRWFVAAVGMATWVLAPRGAPCSDWRDIRNGREIPTESYADQPYVIVTDEGAWLVALTTGGGHEGQPGQHVITTRSLNQGATWSPPVDVEPADGPEASYAVLLKVPGGRIFCFYNHNTDNLREARADDPPYEGGICRRVDSLGYYVFKYSDDHGRSWSEDRYVVDVREMEIDRLNPYGGKVRYFWNVGRPFLHEGAAFLSLHKVGGLGHGFFTRSEGVLIRSENLLAEPDPARFDWSTLPEGDIGLRTPPGGGPIAEEQSYSVLSDGSFFAVYRSIDGHPVCSYSRDLGRTWSQPEYLRFADGRRMKHPRAANFAWKCSNGRYLYWWHNHGGRFIRDHPNAPSIAYNDRNPAWLSGGVEVDSPEGKIIVWSQPEIALYDDDPFIRISYPDLIEDEGRYFLTETQKDVARVHEIPKGFLDTLWSQFDLATVAREGLSLEIPKAGMEIPLEAPAPVLPDFVKRDPQRLDFGTLDLRNGFSIDLRIRIGALSPRQVLVDSRNPSGVGFALLTNDSEGVGIVLNDGRTESRWDSDPGCLKIGKTHHIVVVVDGGPKIISFVIDGKFNDGGEFRQFGWGRFNPNLRGIVGGGRLRIDSTPEVRIERLRIYDRALLTTEAIGNYRSGF